MTAGLAELSFTIMRLPVFYKEKELYLYPAWALTIPMFILRIPWTIIEAGVYLCIVYFLTDFAPEAGRQVLPAKFLILTSGFLEYSHYILQDQYKHLLDK
jgi:hypothetical protein